MLRILIILIAFIGGEQLVIAGNSKSSSDPMVESKRKYNDFIKAYETGDRVKVIEKFPLLVEAARTGHIDSVYTIGLFYSKGEYLEKDVESANEYLTITANEGHLESQVLLGLNYQELGWGKPDELAEKHIEKSNFWLEKASLAGDAVATRELAASVFRYSNNLKEIVKAKNMLEELTKGGDKKAMYYLSVYFEAQYKDLGKKEFKELADYWLAKSKSKGAE